TAADRDLESGPARERERGDDVVRRPAADDQSGPAVNEAVVHSTGRLVAWVPRAKDGPGDLPGEGGDDGGVQAWDHQMLPPVSGLAWIRRSRRRVVGTASPRPGLGGFGLSRRWTRRTAFAPWPPPCLFGHRPALGS